MGERKSLAELKQMAQDDPGYDLGKEQSQEELIKTSMEARADKKKTPVAVTGA